MRTAFKVGVIIRCDLGEKRPKKRGLQLSILHVLDKALSYRAPRQNPFTRRRRPLMHANGRMSAKKAVATCYGLAGWAAKISF